MARDEDGPFYFMTAGGRDTKPSAANPSQHSIKRTETKPGYASINLKSAKVRLVKRAKLELTWETDPKTLPQFAYTITGHDNSSGEGKPLFRIEQVEPHARSAALPIQLPLGQAQIFIRLRCRDILGNQSNLLSVEQQNVE